ncbi:MAG TPA: hypothetical protein VE398_11305 [Acidobacteriota bacterium]|nr:hypothetical protein [Acidobacteriota bacterium]
MKRITQLCAAILFCTAAATAYSQSLADLAKKERERREQVKSNSRLLTNYDASKYRSGPVTIVAPAAAVPAPSAAPATTTDKEAPPADTASKVAKANPDEPVDFQGRPESYWRQTMADARQRVKDLENQANVLVLRMADLQNQFYRESSGFKQQDIQREIQKTIYEQDKNKEELAKAKDQLQDLEKEARKSGALPGWLSSKTP